MGDEKPDLDAICEGPHDYSTSAEAMVTAMVTAGNYVASRLGLTGFQASWAALNAYAKIMDYDCPIIVFKADDLLYPQYDLPGRLADWMHECKPWLAAQARQKLAGDTASVVEPVMRRWKKLAAYEPPADAMTEAVADE